MVRLVDCPEENCGLPAEVLDDTEWPSTEGPVRHLATVCARNHRLLFPVED